MGYSRLVVKQNIVSDDLSRLLTYAQKKVPVRYLEPELCNNLRTNQIIVPTNNPQLKSWERSARSDTYSPRELTTK